MRDFFTLKLLTELIAMFIASMAFSIVCRIDKRHIPMAGILGTVTYIVYYTANFFEADLFTAAFISTAVAAFLSEILARIRRAPTLVFSLVSVIPTVPGGNLYRTMQGLLSNNMQSAYENFVFTMMTGLGIAGGIVSISIVFAILSDVLKKLKNKK